MVSYLYLFAPKWSKIAAVKRFLKDFFLHLFTFEVLFKHLFAPTSPSWEFKIVRDSESLGKSIGKKWSQI